MLECSYWSVLTKKCYYKYLATSNVVFTDVIFTCSLFTSESNPHIQNSPTLGNKSRYLWHTFMHKKIYTSMGLKLRINLNVLCSIRPDFVYLFHYALVAQTKQRKLGRALFKLQLLYSVV